MADNIDVTPGSGATVAADDVAGVLHQQVKLEFGVGGSATMVSASDPLPVTLPNALPAGTNNIGDVDVLSVVPGTGATNLGKAEDAAHASGDTGVAIWGVRRDTAATFGADGDYTPLRVSQFGDQFVQIVDGTGAPITYNANGSATPTNSAPVVVANPTTVATGQVAPAGSAATLLASRALRTRVTFKNIGAVTVYIGPATVTTASGFPLLPGESISYLTTALFQAITASGTGAIAYTEEY